MSLVIHFQKDHSIGGYRIYAGYPTQRGIRPIKISVEVLAETEFPYRLEPTCELDSVQTKEFVSALLEGLQEAGLMPPMNATEAELKATKFHLEDFRSLVFKK